MKHLQTLLATLLIAGSGPLCASQPAPTQEIRALMDRVNAWQLAHPRMKADNRNWERGTWYAGVTEAQRATGDEKYLQQALDWGNLHHWQVGTEGSGANKLLKIEPAPGPLPAGAHPFSVKLEVSNDLDTARANETIEVKPVGPGPVVVRDAAGNEVASQMLGDGAVIFQASFAAKETKNFTVAAGTSAAVEPSTPAIFFVHPTLDYMAWENDRIAFRLYGPQCEKTLVSSGVDVWAKRVTRPVIDAMSKRDYHRDLGDGVDCYSVGKGRGTGGLGIWKDGELYVSRNLKSWKILANGPLRVVIEMDYAPWDAGGIQVSEVKRITLDAGSQLNRIESLLQFSGAEPVTAAIGLGVPKNAGTTLSPDQGWAAVWQATEGKDNGMLGIGMVASSPERTQFKEALGHVLMLSPVDAGQTVTYYAGAGWTKHGFADTAAWNAYLQDFARRLASPLKIELKNPK
jgi:hypothetical protein